MARGRSAPAPARSASSAAARPRPAASPSPPPRPAAPQATSSQQHHAPAPVHHAPAPPPAVPSSGGGGIFSGIMGSVVTGAAMGTGSAIAHRAVDSFMGPRETKVVHEHVGAEAAPAAAPQPMSASGDNCGEFVKSFTDCMSRTQGDMNACEFYMNQMKQCQMRT